MTDHLFAKLFIVTSAIAGFVLASLPAEMLPAEILPASSESLEAWARFGVAGGCLVIVLVGLFYTAPRLTREHRDTVNGMCAAHERTIARICDSHASGMREMRTEQREDNHSMAESVGRLAESVDAMKEAIHEEGRSQRNLQLQQIEQLMTLHHGVKES